jgi:Cu/Ag efflux pump CusA
VLLVYFLLVVNFQSWLDPFIILTALPGALAGIVWMLYITQTTVSVLAASNYLYFVFAVQLAGGVRRHFRAAGLVVEPFHTHFVTDRAGAHG